MDNVSLTKGKEVDKTERSGKLDAFLNVYRTTASACMEWVLKEHHLFALHFDPMKVNAGSKKYLITHCLIKKEHIRDGYKNFDFADLYNNKSLMIEEIRMNLDKYTTRDDRERYIRPILSAFKYTAEPTLLCKNVPEIHGESRGMLLLVVPDADEVAMEYEFSHLFANNRSQICEYQKLIVSLPQK